MRPLSFPVRRQLAPRHRAALQWMWMAAALVALTAWAMCDAAEHKAPGAATADGGSRAPRPPISVRDRGLEMFR